MPNGKSEVIQGKIMRSSLPTTFAVLMLASLFTLPAWAGWVETHAEGKVVFYLDGKIKEAAPDDPKWVVLRIGDQSLWMMDNERRLYSQGTIDDYCRSMETSLAAAMATMSPEERTLLNQLMGKGDRSAGKHPEITIGRVGDAGPPIAGLATEKYMVLVDGKLYEELWLAPDALVHKEFDSVAVRNLEKKMTACLENIAEIVTGNWLTQPEQDAAYQELMQTGWLMRRVSYNNGSPLTEMTVASLERREIAATEFEPPEGFLKVTIEEFIFEE
jgi:hypothetical protein